MALPDMNRFLPIYFEEVGAFLDTLEHGLRALQTGNAGCLDDLVRAAHSIKGASDALGFESVRRLSGAIEQIWRPCLEGKVQIHIAHVEVCLEGVVLLREIVRMHQSGLSVAEADVEAMVFRLEQVLA